MFLFKKKPKACDKCNGKGWVRIPEKPQKIYIAWFMCPCIRCGGTGVIKK